MKIQKVDLKSKYLPNWMEKQDLRLSLIFFGSPKSIFPVCYEPRKFLNTPKSVFQTLWWKTEFVVSLGWKVSGLFTVTLYLGRRSKTASFGRSATNWASMSAGSSNIADLPLLLCQHVGIVVMTLDWESEVPGSNPWDFKDFFFFFFLFLLLFFFSSFFQQNLPRKISF